MTDRVVLHVLPSFDTGGLGSLALTMIRSWPDEDARHVVVAPRYQSTKPDLLPAFAALCGVSNVGDVMRDVMNPPRYVAAMRQLIAQKTKHAHISNVIHYNHTDLAWNVQAIRNFFDGTIAAHVGTVLDPGSAFATGPFRSPFTQNVVYVPASEAVQRGIDACLKACDTKATVSPVIWNGVELDRYRREYTPPRVPFRFGFTGRMAPNAKDWDTLFGAFKLVIDAHVPAVLRIAGDGPLRAQLEEQVRVDRLPVEWVGTVTRDAMPGFLHSLDAFIMAALPIEGMSMALVEAIAACLPILATDVPSNREILAPHPLPKDTDGTTAGYGFLADSVQGLAKLMIELATHPRTHEFMATVSAEYAAHFDARTMAAKYARIGGAG